MRHEIGFMGIRNQGLSMKGYNDAIRLKETEGTLYNLWDTGEIHI